MLLKQYLGKKWRGWICLQNGLHIACRGTLLLLSLLMVSACSSMVRSATNQLADNLALAIADHDDAATVAAGGPAYLLMMDAMVRNAPDDPQLLTKAAELYRAYAGAFVQNPVRSRRLTTKAFGYASRAVCRTRPEDCSLRQVPFEEFEDRITRLTLKDVATYYAFGAAWAGWIQAHKDDLNAVAELARVEMLMGRMLELDEAHMQGEGHLYMGALSILLPPALGGKPEEARHHFERAITLSQGRNLMAKVIYARIYARMLFDRPLHDRLLQEVLTADPNQPGYVLINTMAQQQAEQLLASAEDFFY